MDDELFSVYVVMIDNTEAAFIRLQDVAADGVRELARDVDWDAAQVVLDDAEAGTKI